MWTYVFLFGTAFAAAYVLTPIAYIISGYLGVPGDREERRKIHRKSVSRLGGVPLFLSVLIALTLLFFLKNLVGENFPLNLSYLKAIFFSSTLVFLIGALDDVQPLSAHTKLVLELFAAYWVCSEGVRIERIGHPFGGHFLLGTFLSYGLTILWLVGLTNAFNLVDGIDGLASGIALFACISTTVGSFMQRNEILAIISIPLAGALLAFLRFNFHPARIFLGDSGSLTLGFLFACSAVVWSQKSATLVAVAGPMLVLGLPITEAGLTVIRRFLAGKPIFSADSEHIHHRLLSKGFPTRLVVLILYGIAAIFGALGVLFSRNVNGQILLAIVLFGILLWMGIKRLGYYELHELSANFRSALFSQRSSLSQHIELRRLGDRLAEETDAEKAWKILVEISRRTGFDAVQIEAAQSNDWKTLRSTLIQPSNPSSTISPRDPCWSLAVPICNGDGSRRIVLLRALPCEPNFRVDGTLSDILARLGSESWECLGSDLSARKAEGSAVEATVPERHLP